MLQQNSTPRDLAELVQKKLTGAKIKTPCPDLEVLISLFNTLFYASMKTEESQFIKVTITFIDPNNPDPSPPSRIVADRWNHISFSDRIPFNVKNLVKISKASDPWSSSLAVYYDSENNLFIWGMIDQAIHSQSFLNFESDSGPETPGLFQTSITGIGNIIVMFDYEMIANLKQNILISNYIDVFKHGYISTILNTNTATCKKKITFPDDDIIDWNGHVENIYKESLSRILLRIQNYHHGGAVLITKRIGNDLDIKHKINYNRLFTSIINDTKHSISYIRASNLIDEKYLDKNRKTIPVDLYLDETVSDYDMEDTTSEIKGAIRFIASLSCIDGSIIMTPDLKVKGFGTVIKLNEIPTFIYCSNTSKVYENKLVQVETNHFGTRHRSMFSYCWNNPNSLGYVISQDGDIRAITRINEKLVMWENVKVLKYLRSQRLLRKTFKKLNK